MRFYTADVLTDDSAKHLARLTVIGLIAALPANHPPVHVRAENRRPTVGEALQLWWARRGPSTTPTSSRQRYADVRDRVDTIDRMSQIF